MKKLFVFATAVIATVACTKVTTDEATIPNHKIGFEVANYMTQTKTGETSFLTELSGLGVAAADATFTSAAYIHAAQADGTVADPAAFFAPNPETIKWNTSTTEWEPSKDYYWPKSPKSSIDFFSWYCYEGAAPTLTYTTPFTSATLAWTNRTVAPKSDILYADVAWQQKDNSETYQLDGVSEGVPTLFHHALAQVKFTVKIKDDCDKKADSKNSGYYIFWEVTLDDFAIAPSKVHKNGTLSLSITNPNSTGVTAWTAPTSPAVWANAASPVYVDTEAEWFTTDAATGAAVLTTTAANLIPDSHMGSGYVAVRPQSVGNDMTLNFKMTIKTYYGTQAQFDASNHSGCTLRSTEVIAMNDYDGTAIDTASGDLYTSTGIQLNKLGTTAITAWEMNHKYTYNLIIDPSTNTILYDPAVEAWAAESTGTANIPQ